MSEDTNELLWQQDDVAPSHPGDFAYELGWVALGEHTRMWADEIVDRCYHDSHMYVGEDLWRCDQCGEVIRYIDDPNGNITLTELHPYKNRKVRTEVVVEGRWPS